MAGVNIGAAVVVFDGLPGFPGFSGFSGWVTSVGNVGNGLFGDSVAWLLLICCIVVNAAGCSVVVVVSGVHRSETNFISTIHTNNK